MMKPFRPYSSLKPQHRIFQLSFTVLVELVDWESKMSLILTLTSSVFLQHLVVIRSRVASFVVEQIDWLINEDILPWLSSGVGSRLIGQTCGP